jgi:hypothetical protein
MDFLTQDLIAVHPVWAAIIVITTAFIMSIGIGWLWDITAQWRLSRQRSCPQPYWFIRWKWTAIQLYQKLHQRMKFGKRS